MYVIAQKALRSHFFLTSEAKVKQTTDIHSGDFTD